MRLTVLLTRTAPKAARDLWSRAASGSRPAVMVERREIPLWQERGWKRSGNIYHGSYQTAYGAFLGQIHQRSSSEIDFFLYQPSEAIRSHSHWTCFQDWGKGWYLVHMGRMPSDVSSGIVTIEVLIAEAYTQRP